MTPLDDLIKGIDTIAPLPEIFLKINEMVESQHYSILDIGKIVSKDVGLSAQLLKIVNSSFYHFPSEISTISRAITIIGTKELRNLVLSTAVVKSFNHLKQTIVPLNSFWKHSLYTALAARSLAKQCQLPNYESLFIAGLLHDIGSLVIYEKLPEQSQKISSTATEVSSLDLAEEGLLGFNHAQVGGALIKSWKLPNSLATAVEFHHCPTHTELHQQEAIIVHLANVMANALCEQRNLTDCVPPLHEEAWRLSGLTEEDIAPVIKKTEKQFNEAVFLILGVN